MEFDNSIHDFAFKFNFDSFYSFDEYVERFNEIVPEIEFNDNENLIETLKKYYGFIGKHKAASSDGRPIFSLFNLIHNPGNFDISILEDRLRHQGDIYVQNYYWYIFMIEILNREEDAICSENARIPLHRQIYYEMFLFEPLLDNYIYGIGPAFIRNIRISEKYNMESHDYFSKNEKYKEIEPLLDEVRRKLVIIVEKHFCRLKDNLLDKCMKEEITPSRTLWLSCVPLTYDDLFNLLNKVNNKYIRSSLLFVAGFQNITKISELVRNNIETNAFVLGTNCYKCKENKDKDNNNFQGRCQLSSDGLCAFRSFYFETGHDMEMIDKIYQQFKNIPIHKMNAEQYDNFTDNVFRTQDDFYSFYPFYVFGSKIIYNWQLGRSCGDKYIDNHFRPISIEYKKYYKDYNSKLSFYINENEDNDLLPRATYSTSISCKILN